MRKVELAIPERERDLDVALADEDGRNQAAGPDVERDAVGGRGEAFGEEPGRDGSASVNARTTSAGGASTTCCSVNMIRTSGVDDSITVPGGVYGLLSVGSWSA